MKKLRIIFLYLLFSITVNFAYPQGCNDAGLCTMGDLDGQRTGQSEQFNTLLSYTFGLGEKQALVNTIQFEQRLNFADDKLQFFLKVPFHYIYGNLGRAYGPGDLSAGINYTFYNKDEAGASFMLAARLPVNDANKNIDGKGAPMVYQTSLGTYDLAAGTSLFYGKWQFGLGYLKPFGSNGNSFNHAEWPDNPDALEYIEMRDLARGDDAMLRINRFFYTEKSRFNAGLLTLYRVQKDRVTQYGQRVELENSDGLTINLNLGYHRVLKNHDAITLSAAAPLITRKVRADGLTRTFVLMLTYAFGQKKPAETISPFNFGG
jgi:hypothetical protein